MNYSIEQWSLDNGTTIEIQKDTITGIIQAIESVELTIPKIHNNTRWSDYKHGFNIRVYNKYNDQTYYEEDKCFDNTYQNTLFDMAEKIIYGVPNYQIIDIKEIRKNNTMEYDVLYSYETEIDLNNQYFIDNWNKYIYKKWIVKITEQQISYETEDGPYGKTTYIFTPVDYNINKIDFTNFNAEINICILSNRNNFINSITSLLEYYNTEQPEGYIEYINLLQNMHYPEDIFNHLVK